MSEKKTASYYSPPTTEFYVPGLQFAIRILMAMLTAVYFYWRPVEPLVFHPQMFALCFVGYFAFHLIWWQHYQLHGMGGLGIRLANWMDLFGAAIVFSNDSMVVPPTMVLIFIAILGNGLQHGLKVFSELLIGAVVIGGASIPLRQTALGEMPPYNVPFLMLFLVVGLYYIYLLIIRIEHLKQQAVQTSELDPLTGMPNRRAFFRLARYLIALHDRTSLPLVVMYADMDRFKEVNDKHGHEMGDKVLQAFAEIVRQGFRKVDISARLGGDEFVFMMADMTIEDAGNVALRLKQEFRSWAAGQNLSVDISFGMGAFPADSISLDDMLRHVDGAMYEAKRQNGEPGIAVATSL